MLTTLPAKTDADLGEALTNSRSPRANEESAVHHENIKDRLIQIGADLGTDATPAAGSVKARLNDLEAGASARPTIETLSGTSDALADADNGKLVRCTNGSTVTITVPTGLTPGTTVEYLQEGAGQVVIAAGGGMTLRRAATFNPATSEQWSSVVVTILDTNEALVRGDLEAA